MKRSKFSTKKFFRAVGTSFRVLVLISVLVPLFTHLSAARAEVGIDWIRRIATHHEQPSHNFRVSTAIGSDGSAYIFGSTDGTLEGKTPVGGNDLFIRKFSSDGNEIWSRQFGTTGDDFGSGIVVDASGVYLAGSTTGAFEGFTNTGLDDSFVAKFDLDGSPVWTRQFGCSERDLTTGVALTTDGVVITGYGSCAMEGAAYLGGDDSYIRKYTLDGALQWSTSFGTDSDDQSLGIAVDGTGAYVAGSSGESLFVKKFDTSGNEVWSQAFAGAGQVGYDEFAAISAYGSRIYVAGSTARQFTTEPNAGYNDVFIKTFGADGTEMWTVQFGTPMDDGAYTLAVDNSGVYVGGITRGQFPGFPFNGYYYDAFIRQYSLEGIVGWTLQFGTANTDDLTGLAVNPDAIYMAGRATGSLDGQVSSGGTDIYLKKIDLNANPVWTLQFNPIATPPDHEYATAVDANGNAYLAGSIMPNVLEPTAIRPESAFVAKYTPDGTQAWLKIFASQPHLGADVAYGVAADAAGNVYVTGSASGDLNGISSSGYGGAFLVKYDPDGNLIWTRLLSASAGYKVVVDSNGVYIAGTKTVITGNWQYQSYVFVRMFSPDGVELWADEFRSSSNDYLKGLAIHSSGLYLGGYTFGTLEGQTSAGSYDAFMRKYNLDGSVSWTHQFGTSAMDELMGIDVDDSGVYVTGGTSGALGDQVGSGGFDVFVQKYSLDGNMLWTRQFAPAQSNLGTGIAVSPSGLYVVGKSYLQTLSIHQYESFIRKFSLDGEEAWSRSFDNQTELEEAVGVAVDASGIYVAGQIYIMDRFYSLDATLIKISLNENEAPVVGAITAPAAPVAVSTPISASANFTDANAADTHTATWDWGNGTTSAGTVTESGGSGTVSGATTYTVPGVYELKVTVADQAGLEGNSTYQYVVVYDPSAGFVTGGGSMLSPAGAYKPNEGLSGVATFGFVSRYKKGASIPSGNTAFNFDLAGMSFASQSYEWLVVNQGGTNAQFKGSGTVNGALDPNGHAYKFMVWAGDGSPDTFRISIWWEDASGAVTVLYDNGSNQAIGGGNIVVHTSK